MDEVTEILPRFSWPSTELRRETARGIATVVIRPRNRKKRVTTKNGQLLCDEEKEEEKEEDFRDREDARVREKRRALYLQTRGLYWSTV